MTQRYFLPLIKSIHEFTPQKEDYERALRLYDYCVNSGEEPEYFAQRVEELKKVWREKTE